MLRQHKVLYRCKTIKKLLKTEFYIIVKLKKFDVLKGFINF